MRVLRSVTATKGLHQTDNLSALFKSAFHQRDIDQMGEEWIGRDKQMSPRD